MWKTRGLVWEERRWSAPPENTRLIFATFLLESLAQTKVNWQDLDQCNLNGNVKIGSWEDMRDTEVLSTRIPIFYTKHVIKKKTRNYRMRLSMVSWRNYAYWGGFYPSRPKTKANNTPCDLHNFSDHTKAESILHIQNNSRYKKKLKQAYFERCLSSRLRLPVSRYS